MKNKQKIEKALIAKGYKPTFIEFEPISYYSTGREGGWDVSVFIDDNDHCFPSWEDITKPDGLIVDFFDGSLMAYNITDVLKAIELIPHYDSNRQTFDD